MSLALLMVATAAGPAGSATAPSVARQMGAAVADAVERVMPAVVVVRTEAVQMHLARDPFRGRLYRIPERLAGQGSGAIIRKDGYVLTSHHVVKDAQQIEVALPDGTKFAAKVVGRDPLTDLAVLQIEQAGGRTFPVIEPGDSDKLRVGEFVIAIGSPFSLNSSVTLGIISQKGRAVGLLPYEDFIQTDASINPGNSGGPLVDMDGRLAGINAVIQTASPYAQGNIGIGFAVPANLALRVAQELIAHGRMDRPWLGIQMRDHEQEADAAPRTGRRARSAGAPGGVEVVEVIANAPAAKAGLRVGDLLRRVADQPVTSTHAVQRLVWKFRTGETILIEVSRGGQTKVFKVITERMPDVSREQAEQ
ncbi:MAG: trypsin-like peptidase domain-containing protein [Kiritimatiellaeota bacterium]|nr:trypsin-like peptidase domain-containing protein [Kiritimatiellota bacterium]